MNGDVMPASLIRVLFLFANTSPGTSRVTISEVEANDRTQMTVSDSGHKNNVFFGDFCTRSLTHTLFTCASLHVQEYYFMNRAIISMTQHEQLHPVMRKHLPVKGSLRRPKRVDFQRSSGRPLTPQPPSPFEQQIANAPPLPPPPLFTI